MRARGPACPLRLGGGCRVVEGTCARLRRFYVEHHWDRYVKILNDRAYLDAVRPSLPRSPAALRRLLLGKER